MKKYPLPLLAVAFAAQTVLGVIPPPITRPVTISGTVMDDPYPLKRMSQPVPKATLTLWQELQIMDGVEATDASILPLWRLMDSTISDDRGAFTFQPHTAYAWQIRCTHPEYADRQITVYTMKDTAVQVTVVSKDARAIVAGSVHASCRDPMGMPCIMPPVVGCTVTVSKPLIFSITGSIVPVFSAVTDEQGRYLVNDIPLSYNGEPVVVTSRKAGYTTKSVDTVIRNTTTTTVNFVLDETGNTLNDTAIVSPATPTNNDRLTILLKNTTHCCATEFTENAVTVRDSVILLSYVYNDSLCSIVRCLVGGSQTTFTSDPLKPGRYVIYRVETPYCPPPRICPPAVISPVRVGSVTVSNALAVGPSPAGTARAGDRLTVTGSTIATTIGQSGLVCLRVYNVRGALLAELHRGWTPAGTILHHDLSTIRATDGAKGLRIVRLSTDGSGTTTTAVMVPR